LISGFIDGWQTRTAQRRLERAQRDLQIAKLEQEAAEIRNQAKRVKAPAKPTVAAPLPRHDGATVLILQHQERTGKLPTARQLNREYGVAIGTADRALKRIAS